MKANATRPEIEQILFSDQLKREPAERGARALHLSSPHRDAGAAPANLDLYVCSLSACVADLQGHVPRRGLSTASIPT